MKSALPFALTILFCAHAIAEGGEKFITGQRTSDAGYSTEGATRAIVELGGGKYQIGPIEVDKQAGSFSVLGSVIEHDTSGIPIEFLAVTRDSRKSYEAVFEINATAVEFNLACIVLGLDETRATKPQFHFDPTPVTGDQLDIEVSWQTSDGQVNLDLLDIVYLLDASGQVVIENDHEAESGDWVYTGSYFLPDGAYMADLDGTLIGVVHDPQSIIQHGSGLGLGNYGAVSADFLRLPSPDVTVRMTISRTGQ